MGAILIRLAAFLLCLVACAAQAQTVVQVNHGSLSLSNGSTSSGSAVFGSNVTSGNKIIVVLGFRDTAAFSGSITVSDTETNTFTQRDGPCAVTVSPRSVVTYVYTASVGSSAADTVSVSISGGTAIKGGAVFAYEVSGLSSAVPFSAGCGTSASDSNSITSLTTLKNLVFTGSPLLIAFAQYNASGACTLSHSSGTWTTLQEDGANDEFDSFYATGGSGVSSPTNFPNGCSTGGAPATVLGEAFGGTVTTPPTLDTNNGANGTTGTSGTISVSTSGANELVYIGVATLKTGSANTVSSISDGSSLTWAKRSANSGTRSTCSGVIDVEFWWSYAASQLTSDTVTVHLAGAGTMFMIGSATYTGVASSTTPFDPNGSLAAVNSTDSGGTTATVTLSTTNAADMVIAAAANCVNSNQMAAKCSGSTDGLFNWYTNSADPSTTFRFPACDYQETAAQTSQSFSATDGATVSGSYIAVGDAITGNAALAAATGFLPMIGIGQ